MAARRTQRLLNWVAGLAVLGVVAGLVVTILLPADNGRKVTAYFSRSTGLYAGDDVRVLGVKVGTVQSITPGPSSVKVVFTVADDVRLPAQVKAAIVAPSLVSGRFVQLVPGYSGGPQLTAGTPIPLGRTAEPVEWNTLETQLTRLAAALGPTATDPKGALSGVLTTVDANLHGSAAQLNSMLQSLSAATATVSDNRGNLFGTITALRQFLDALNNSDAQVRSFSGQLNTVSALLADDRASLGTALSSLSTAVTGLRTFLTANRSKLTGAVKATETLSKTLSAKNYQIAELLHVAPTALDNFYNIIDPRYQSAVGTITLSGFDNLTQLVCRAVISQGGTVDTCIQVLTPVLTALHLQTLTPQLSTELQNLFGGVTPTPSTGTGTTTGNGAGASGKTAASANTAASGADAGLAGDPSQTGALLQLLLPGGGQ